MINYKQTIENFKIKPFSNLIKFSLYIGTLVLVLNAFLGKETFADRVAAFEEMQLYCSNLDARLNNNISVNEVSLINRDDFKAITQKASVCGSFNAISFLGPITFLLYNPKFEPSFNKSA